MPETEAPAKGADDKATKPPEAAKQPEKTEPAKPDPDAALLQGADNPDAVKNALSAERKTAKDAAKRAEAAEAKVQEFEERDKTESEKLTGKVESLTSESKNIKAENLRLRVALEKKLPPELIDRLKGDSKEAIEADADELMKLVKTENPPPTMDGGAREPAGDSKSPERAHNDLLLKSFGRPRSST